MLENGYANWLENRKELSALRNSVLVKDPISLAWEIYGFDVEIAQINSRGSTNKRIDVSTAGREIAVGNSEKDEPGSR